MVTTRSSNLPTLLNNFLHISSSLSLIILFITPRNGQHKSFSLISIPNIRWKLRYQHVSAILEAFKAASLSAIIGSPARVWKKRDNSTTVASHMHILHCQCIFSHLSYQGLLRPCQNNSQTPRSAYTPAGSAEKPSKSSDSIPVDGLT